MESKSNIKKPRNILEMSSDEKLDFLNSIDIIFSDIDGVVWNQVSPINGSGDGFNELKKAGKNFTFLTNNSVRPDKDYIRRFKETGIEYDVQNIIHPARNVVDYLLDINFDGAIYCIATEAFKQVLRKAGFKIIDGPNKILQESFSDLAQNIFDQEDIGAVVIDVDFNLSSAKLMRAHQYLRRFPDCLLIGGATDMILPIGPGIEVIGPGPYLKVLVDASKRKPIILGKPGLELGDMLVRRFGITDRKRTMMIGDMLEQDIGFGNKNGFQTLVVLSGGCKEEHLKSVKNPDEIPDFYAHSMADFVKFFEDISRN